MSDWNPELYNRFRQFCAEPFLHIMERLRLSSRERIVDLGCGSGENTIELLRRTEKGHALGVDSSSAMIERANIARAALEASLRNRLQFRLADLSAFNDKAEYTLIFSNAALQWVPDHRDIFAGIFIALKPGGRIAIQMPANDNETAKIEISNLARESRWMAELGGMDEPFRIVPPATYYENLLHELGFAEITCYYRTFAHPMSSPADIIEFYRSTGLRPFLDQLAPAYHEEFIADLLDRLEHAYGTAGPVTFNFRRLFIWAERPGQ